MPPGSVYPLNLAFLSFLNTSCLAKINLNKFDVWLFKTNHPGKSTFAKHSMTCWLPFFSPSFFTPSWSIYYNYRRNRSGLTNNFMNHTFSIHFSYQHLFETPSTLLASWSSLATTISDTPNVITAHRINP